MGKKQKTHQQQHMFFTVLLGANDAKRQLPARLQKAQGDGEKQGNSDACLDVLAQHLLLEGFRKDSGINASDL